MSCVVASRRALLCRIGSAISSSSNGLLLHRLGCYSSWLRVRHQTTTQDYSLQTPKTVLSSLPSSSSSIVSTIETERRGLPWLFLTTWSSSENYTRHLYDVDFDQEKQISRKIKLPSEMNLHDIIGSSEGYLLTIDYFTQEIHAMNPLTGSYLLLPSTASLPNMIGILRNSISADTITHYVIQYDKHDDHNDPKIEQYLYQGKGSNSFLFQRIDPTSTMAIKKMRQKDYYGKAILSPSLDAAVVIHGLYPEGQLAFVRIGQQTPPPSTWTPLHNSILSSATRFIDIIFHQGRLHALDNLGTLTIFDLDNTSSPPLFRSAAGNPVKDDKDKKLGEGYLVESPNGDDLFAVYRDIQNNGNTTRPPRTRTFKVYKLDKISYSYKWERVESIGDLAFFLGYNRSSSLSTLDFPPGHLKCNSIYFTDNCYTSDYPDEVGDTGVFSLEDGSFEFYPINNGNNKFNEARPVWLMPPTILGSS